MLETDGFNGTHAQIRYQAQQAQRQLYIAAHQSYALEFGSFTATQPHYQRALKSSSLLDEQIAHSMALSLSESSTFNSQNATISGDLKFLRREITDMERTRQLSVLSGFLDSALRISRVGSFVAERVFYPRNFMSKQLTQVQGMADLVAQHHHQKQEGYAATLEDLRMRRSVISAEIAETESGWALSGDAERLVHYVVDNPETKADLFTKFLMAHPEVKKQLLFEKFDRYASLRSLVDKEVRSKAAQLNQAESTVQIDEVLPEEEPDDLDFEEIPLEELQRGFKNPLYIQESDFTEPELIEDPSEIPDRLGDATDYIKRQVLKRLHFIDEILADDPIQVYQFYRETITQGPFSGYKEVRITKKYRVLFRIQDGSIYFRAADHDVVRTGTRIRK